MCLFEASSTVLAGSEVEHEESQSISGDLRAALRCVQGMLVGRAPEWPQLTPSARRPCTCQPQASPPTFQMRWWRHTYHVLRDILGFDLAVRSRQYGVAIARGRPHPGREAMRFLGLPLAPPVGERGGRGQPTGVHAGVASVRMTSHIGVKTSAIGSAPLSRPLGRLRPAAPSAQGGFSNAARTLPPGLPATPCARCGSDGGGAVARGQWRAWPALAWPFWLWRAVHQRPKRRTPSMPCPPAAFTARRRRRRRPCAPVPTAACGRRGIRGSAPAASSPRPHR
jgi:hypothetical protein